MGSGEIRDALESVRAFLAEQVGEHDDDVRWAAQCLTEFLEGRAPSLDHAFGLRSSKRGPKPMIEGRHDDWVAEAWARIMVETPAGAEWPNTKALADIGRYFGLGGKDSAHAEDHAVASELKRIIERYRAIIVQQVSDDLAARLDQG